eukprot:GHVU01017109.1.p1 GENE.GHVU01017109.1~~GHVU01017109.1.p1  ORF type:complete len:688 (-),score=145.05 GHVU01017109.1:1053-3116(-)
MGSGNVTIHNYESQCLVKSIEVSPGSPVRCSKFVPKKQLIVCGGDDLTLRAYNYNTSEKVAELKAHTDYIRSVVAHPTLPYVLTTSDDTTIKLWDIDSGWERLQTFEGHSHYVFMAKWNPKDPHIFATASMDTHIKVWGIHSPGVAAGGTITTPHFTLSGHTRGVNCLDYNNHGERPYIVSGSDDKTVRVWDYQTKQCVQVLQGHDKDIAAVAFHPHLPVLLSAAEDGTIRIWHSLTYRLESTINYIMGRGWCLATLPGSNDVAMGFDEGTVVAKVGSEAPVSSMHAGKIVWAKGFELQNCNMRLVDHSIYADGERLPLSTKDMGACEIFPQSMSHHPNGRFLAVCGDGEYIIYTAQALRNKAFGKALYFVWGPEGQYATKDEGGRVTLFKDFQEHNSFKPPYGVDALFGGRLIGLKSADFICFYDWNEARLIRRIDVAPNSVWWSDSGTQVCLACPDSFFILRHDKDAVLAMVTGGVPDQDGGLEVAFDLEQEVAGRVETGCWVAESFIYVTDTLRLQSFTAGRIDTIAYVEPKTYILGYMPETNRIYLGDRDFNVTSHTLYLDFFEYQACIIKKDFVGAEAYFAKIPASLHAKVARFLESQGQKERALDITSDPDHQFDIALSLGRLQMVGAGAGRRPCSDGPVDGAASAPPSGRRGRVGDSAPPPRPVTSNIVDDDRTASLCCS